MCLSATASFAAAGTTFLIGAATPGRAHTARALPMAAIPMIFAVQQAIEGALWLEPPADSGSLASPQLVAPRGVIKTPGPWLIRIKDENRIAQDHSRSHQEAGMQSFRVKFMNDLTNSSGHVFHCCQETIEIRAAKSRERAVEAAKRRFARRQSVPNWTVHAHTIDVEEIAPAT